VPVAYSYDRYLLQPIMPIHECSTGASRIRPRAEVCSIVSSPHVLYNQVAAPYHHELTCNRLVVQYLEIALMEIRKVETTTASASSTTKSKGLGGLVSNKKYQQVTIYCYTMKTVTFDFRGSSDERKEFYSLLLGLLPNDPSQSFARAFRTTVRNATCRATLMAVEPRLSLSLSLSLTHRHNVVAYSFLSHQSPSHPTTTRKNFTGSSVAAPIGDSRKPISSTSFASRIPRNSSSRLQSATRNCGRLPPIEVMEGCRVSAGDWTEMEPYVSNQPNDTSSSSSPLSLPCSTRHNSKLLPTIHPFRFLHRRRGKKAPEWLVRRTTTSSYALLRWQPRRVSCMSLSRTVRHRSLP